MGRPEEGCSLDLATSDPAWDAGPKDDRSVFNFGDSLMVEKYIKKDRAATPFCENKSPICDSWFVSSVHSSGLNGRRANRLAPAGFGRIWFDRVCLVTGGSGFHRRF